MTQLKTARTVIMLTADARKSLEKLSATTGAPLSELIRRSVDTYLAKQGKQ